MQRAHGFLITLVLVIVGRMAASFVVRPLAVPSPPAYIPAPAPSAPAPAPSETPWPTPIYPLPTPTLESGSRLLLSNVYNAVLAGQLLLAGPIYGYDLAQNRAFTITQTGSIAVAGDEQTVVWSSSVETPTGAIGGAVDSTTTLWSYDLPTRRLSTLVPANPDPDLGTSLALNGGVLYYQTGAGIVARTLATGQEHLLAANGQRPVAADGKVVWMDEVLPPPLPTPTPIIPPRVGTVTIPVPVYGTPLQGTWRLHLHIQNSTLPDQIIASGQSTSGILNYALSGDNVVYAEEGQPIGVYNLRSGASRQIAAGRTSSLTINGPFVVWSEEIMSDSGGEPTDSLQASNLDTGTRYTVLPPRPGLLRVMALIGQRAIAYLADDRIYLRDLPVAP